MPQTPPGSGARVPRRRDRLIRERVHDPYQLREKLADPTVCRDCGAMFRRGRWAWTPAPADAHVALCPACHRIQDDYPEGSVALAGEFVKANRDEILGLVRNVESREKREHPLKRIMRISDEDDHIVIETTSAKLAHAIGVALNDAYAGTLDAGFPDEGGLLRVAWTR